jgi:hypothetical protein
MLKSPRRLVAPAVAQNLALELRAPRADKTAVDARPASQPTQAGASTLNRRVCVLAVTTAEGVRRGRVIHVGSDGNLLVIWDDDARTSLVEPDKLVENPPET